MDIRYIILGFFVLAIGGCSVDVGDLNGSPIGEDYALILYQPMQCQSEPWIGWFENSDINFVKAPTDEELIVRYYLEEFDVELIDVLRVDPGFAVCEACDVCPKEFYFSAKVPLNRVVVMENLGWNILKS